MGRNRLVEGNDSFGGAQFRQDRWQRIHGEAWMTSSTTTGPSSPRHHGRPRAQWRRHTPQNQRQGSGVGPPVSHLPDGWRTNGVGRPVEATDARGRHGIIPGPVPVGPERFQAARGEGRGDGAWREVRTPEFAIAGGSGLGEWWSGGEERMGSQAMKKIARYRNIAPA